MSPSTVAVVVALSASGVVLAILAFRLASISRDLAKVRRALDRATQDTTHLRAALVDAGHKNGTLERSLLIVRERHAERLRYLRGQLDECSDPSVRARVAVDGIRRILRSIETPGDDPDRQRANRLLTDRDAVTDG